MKRESRAPLIVAIVLLPLLYVASYLTLVMPGAAGPITISSEGWYLVRSRYRFGGQTTELIFYPLEQIDRKVRPSAWEFDRVLGAPPPQFWLP